ncbi:MAG: glycosyltransferase, partial [Nitrospiraceae bacterium]
CIANDIPPNREMLADGAAGVLVPVGEADQLLVAMRRVATDAAHAEFLRTAARLRVTEHYTIEAVAGSYQRLYRYLIDGCPPS